MKHDINSLRHLWEQENLLRNQRVNWFLVFQGLILNAVNWGSEDHKLATFFICCIGIVVSASFWVLFSQGTLATRSIKQEAERLGLNTKLIMGFRHDNANSISVSLHWLLPWKILPIVCISLWVAIGACLFFDCNCVLTK